MIWLQSNYDTKFKGKESLPLVLTDGEAHVPLTFIRTRWASANGGYDCWEWVGLNDLVNLGILQMVFAEYCINHDIESFELGGHAAIVLPSLDETSEDWK